MTFAKGISPPTKGKGKAYAFLAALKGHQGDDCVTWPFFRDKHGRGMVGYNGKMGWAHRVMCTLEYGDPPTPKHTAAHECGNGHLGCVNPKHLKWKTQKENLADCARHGTSVRHSYGPFGKLDFEKAQQIRDLKETHTQGQLADMFGVSEGAINDIWRGRCWSRPHMKPQWSAEEDTKLIELLAGGATYSQAGKVLGRNVSGRAHRLGIRSKWDPHALRGPMKKQTRAHEQCAKSERS
jgi:hypothetical protein